MYRTHTCGALRIEHVGQQVTLAGWVQRTRDLGGMTFVDLRDRYGITQLAFNLEEQEELCLQARKLGREFVVRATGTVIERSSKNPQLPTGDIELQVAELQVLNRSEVPPFTIEDETDGGEELRMKYRYLDLRRNPLRNNLELRHRTAMAVRNYLSNEGFLEIETPYLIKSTPEGARDFVVPSSVHPGQFYALPQSPQTFKQLLMVSGYDRYFQLVRCFRDEAQRADRQVEFTQIDCEMAFVEQEDVLTTFEALARDVFRKVLDHELGDVPRMTYAEAMEHYGSDKPDLRFGMRLQNLTERGQGQGFRVFDDAETILSICVPGGAVYSRKQLDQWTEWVKRPQIGAKGLVWIKYQEDGSIKSSIDKFFEAEALQGWMETAEASPGDLMFVLAGAEKATRFAAGELRLELGTQLGLRDPFAFAPLWVVDFPLLEWDEETERYHAMHHPFTAPKPEHVEWLDNDPGKVLANAYDLVINGVEIGGGSIRIHDEDLQARMFELLGFSEEEARAQFGFLMHAFRYGAPPHGGIAFGFDRLVTVLAGKESIRDFIAFPKNNAGRDVMIDAPSTLAEEQMDELQLKVEAHEQA